MDDAKQCKHGTYSPDGGCWEECDQKEDAYNTGYRQGRKDAEEAIKIAAGASEARGWSLPPEPGPEVKAVRLAGGDLYQRLFIDGIPAGWVEPVGPVISWQDFFVHPCYDGPLTDATHELEES